uniref:Uncharacterized protein n=1 Tax=Corethron hystrix TaxID=216773 RepID=A0A7S1FWU7_9STRA
MPSLNDEKGRLRRRKNPATANATFLLIAAALIAAVLPPYSRRPYGVAAFSTVRLASPALLTRRPPPRRASSIMAGGGFGGAPSPAGKKKKGGKKKSVSPAADNTKVRTVSGFSGSGTKPLRIAANTFDRIYQKHGKECAADLYVRSPANDADLGREPTYWFVGKVVADPDAGPPPPSVRAAVLAQKRLVLEYAQRELRPQNLGGKYANGLQIWTAPGDSELDVVQNKVPLTRVEGSTADLLAEENFDVRDVGFNPEIYVGDEIRDGGLRVTRDEEGKPTRPVFEINEGQ